MNAQQLTQEEAYKISEKLLKHEILTKKGKELLDNKITKNDFERGKRISLTDGSFGTHDELSASHVLIFLTKAFASDFQYRSGSLEQIKYIKKLQEEKGDIPLSEEDYENMNENMDEILKDFIGYKIEESIPYEDNAFIPAKEISVNSSDFFGLNTEDYDVIHHNRSVYGKTLYKTLSDLLEIGLINQTIYNDVNPKIRSEKLFFEFKLLEYLTRKVIFYEDFDENKQKELAFLSSLNKEKIISNANFKELKILNNKLLNKYELIPYCEKAKVFPLKNYSSNPKEGFKSIFEDIKEIIPEFDFTNFETNIIEKTDYELIERSVQISFIVNGTKYQNAFFYDYQKPDEQEKDSLLKVSIDFHQGINKFLADLNSEYRLYFANNAYESERNPYGENEFGLILLTENQFNTLVGENSHYFMFKQSHSNKFNTENIKNIVESYKKIGLFKHLSQAEIHKSEACVLKNNIQSYQDILLCFPKTIIYFDWETGNLENPYEELITEISQATRGAFDVKNIKDNFEDSWEKEAVDISFDFNNKKYKTTLEMDGDWLDTRFLGFILSIMQENHVNGKIYACIDDGQATGYIFLDSAQYKWFNENQKDFILTEISKPESDF